MTGLQMQTEPGRRSFRFLKLIFRQDAFPPPLPPPVNKLHPEPSLAVFVFLRGGTVSKYEANSFGSRKGRPDTEREVGGGGPDPGSPPPHPPSPNSSSSSSHPPRKPKGPDSAPFAGWQHPTPLGSDGTGEK